MTIGIILAAGMGTRMRSSSENKTSLVVAGKPLVQYGVDLYTKTVDEILVVVGAFAESVKNSIDGEVRFVAQEQQLGTGHAVQVAVQSLLQEEQAPDYVFVGYGDHMMHYTAEMLAQMKTGMERESIDMMLLATTYPNPDQLAWGRVVCDENENVLRVVEQKDASIEERKIQRINAGFYCFSFAFLKQYIFSIQPSKITGEYYLTDLVEIAVQAHRVVRFYEVPFENVGTGVNTVDQLLDTEKRMTRSYVG